MPGWRQESRNEPGALWGGCEGRHPHAKQGSRLPSYRSIRTRHAAAHLQRAPPTCSVTRRSRGAVRPQPKPLTLRFEAMAPGRPSSYSGAALSPSGRQAHRGPCRGAQQFFLSMGTKERQRLSNSAAGCTDRRHILVAAYTARGEALLARGAQALLAVSLPALAFAPSLRWRPATDRHRCALCRFFPPSLID